MQSTRDELLMALESRVVGEKVGVKAFFLYCPMEGALQVGLIRDSGKPLDALGGHVEVGETPLQAMIRESREELSYRAHPTKKVELDPRQFAYHGVTQGGGYASHVYTYMVMEDPRQYAGVELFSMVNFSDWERSTQGYPRQPWLSRHLLFMEEQYKNVITLFLAHEMIVDQLPLGAPPLACICSSPEVQWEKLRKHELAYGRKVMRLQDVLEKEMGLTDIQANQRLLESWPPPGFTAHMLEKRAEKRVEKYLPQDLEEIKKLVKQVFEFCGQRELAVADFNKALIKMGYFFGTKTIKAFGRRVKAEGIVVEVFRPSMVGGRGYQLPLEVRKVENVPQGEERTVRVDNASLVISKAF